MCCSMVIIDLSEQYKTKQQQKKGCVTKQTTTTTTTKKGCVDIQCLNCEIRADGFRLLRLSFPEDVSIFSTRRHARGGISPPLLSARSAAWGLSPALPPFSPLMMSPRMQQQHHPAFSALSRQMWMCRPRPRMQYSQSQITAGILDVEMGKSISKAAKDNGVPFTSLYRKVKAHSSQRTEDGQPPPPPPPPPPLPPHSEDPLSFMVEPQLAEDALPFVVQPQPAEDSLPFAVEPQPAEDLPPFAVQPQSAGEERRHSEEEPPPVAAGEPRSADETPLPPEEPPLLAEDPGLLEDPHQLKLDRE